MKLLVIANNLNRASFRQRIGIYFDVLRKNGINCEVAKLPPGLLKRRILFKHAKDFDGVFLQKKKLNLFDASVLRRRSKKIIYDFDDAVMFNPNRPDVKSLSHLLPFRRTAKLADVVIAGNEYLAGWAKKYNKNVAVIPTGLDTTKYQINIKKPKDDKIRLVWIGSKSTLAYLARIKPALEEIGKRFNNVILRVICDDFFDLQNLPVEKRRWSEQTEVIDLAGSDIGLAPLPDNNFTRGKCGFKILQYAAAGQPVVASPVGTNADYIRDGITGFFAADTQQWIGTICQLVKNPQLRKCMGEEGRKQTEKFDVSITGAKLANLINRCLKNAS